METLHRLLKGGFDTELLFSRGLEDPIRAATDTDVAHALVAGLVITREFGPGAVHGKRHSGSGHYSSRRRREIHRSRTRSGIFPIALHALIIATIVLNLNISPSWSGEYRRVRVRTCHD